MDAFENTDYEYIPEVPEEPVPSAPQPSRENPYHGTGAGRKESPYANSPYEAYQAPRQEYQYRPQTEPPVKPKKVKNARKPMGKKVLAVVLALVLVAGTAFATAGFMNAKWNTVLNTTTKNYDQQIQDLQKKIDSLPSVPGGITSRPNDGSAMTPAQLYASQVNSVVAIATKVQTGYGSGESSGSGFILTKDGYFDIHR